MAHTDAEIEAKFWAALRRDVTVMLSIGRHQDARPMAAQLEGKEDRGPIWFFASSDTMVVQEAEDAQDATFSFVSKGFDVWANVIGSVTVVRDRAKIDELWSPQTAAWFEGGKDDPKIRLLRFDPSEAKIWLDGSTFLAGVLSLLGRDPQDSYKDNIAEVSLR